MAVRCAPPDNKPTPEEIRNCFVHLEDEVGALNRVRVVVALGKVGFDSYVRWMTSRGHRRGPRPHFGHGLTYRLVEGPTLIGCYHPSRQNTHTGKLTPEMIDRIFRDVRRLLARS
jgi:uracil-DNA glycosylase